MARPASDDEMEKPLDPAVEKVRRKLVRFVAINLGLLFAALMIVVAALVYKSFKTEPAPAVVDAGVEIPSPEGVVEGQIVLPAGARIISQSFSGNRVSLALELADGSRALYIYDLLSRRVVGRFVVTED
ncbi:MAG: fimbrial protein [Rhizobiaceae bacterium]|nr:fimbrial protein [Rhizobiaceae bacterium]